MFSQKKMIELLDLIFLHNSLIERPPTLLDIGASGETYPLWKNLMPYSHYISFEADDREIDTLRSDKSSWKKHLSFQSIATADEAEQLLMHLTKFPFCSSTLSPDKTSLSNWDFASLFEVEQSVTLSAENLSKALLNSGILYIDWFKTDSQGTDLRLFASLPEKIRGKILVADFEPGIIDAYKGEDKLHHLLAHMDTEPFWVNSMEVKGAKRITQDNLKTLSDSQIDLAIKKQKNSPCWCEISYLNDMESRDLGLREHLLAWVFSTILEQHGFALKIANAGSEKFQDDLFSKLQKSSIASLS
jgi:hypothetical protein